MTVIRAFSNQLRTSIPRAVSLRTIRSIGGPHGAALHPKRAGFDMMSGPRAAKPDSTGTGVAGLPPDSCYVGTAPSTTGVRSQSPAGSGPLNADKHQGRRQVPAETALRVGLRSARRFCY